MKFFKNKLRIKKENGPTVIFFSSDGPSEEEENRFLASATEQIKPCERTFEELERYLMEKYQAVPHALSSIQLNVLKANVILAYFSHILEEPMTLEGNPREEEQKDYFKHSKAKFLKAKEYPADKLGLEFKAYRIPEGLRMRNQKKELKAIDSGCTEKDIIIEVETTTKYLSISNGNEEMMSDLVLFKGVSEKDIIEKSPRFIEYAYVLRRLGKL